MPQVFAAIDIGTNSIRMAVVRVEDAERLTTLAQHREVVRLGEGEFETNRMSQAAIDRGALVCARFADVARGFGAQEIIAFATSAVREAENRDDFIDRVRRDAGIEVRVISGVEEARLIWLGVSSGVELGGREGLLIDIGGGSTEVIVGDAQGPHLLESMRLGAIRLSNRFFPDGGQVPPEVFARVQRYVYAAAVQVIRKLRERRFESAIGSAGTITTLAEIIAHRSVEPTAVRQGVAFRTADLRAVVQMLCKMTLEERRAVPGMDAGRADIILGGAAILLTLLEECGIERLTPSERGLRDGILLDHLLREEGSRKRFQAISVRRRSILQLARACNYEEQHASHTAFLALRLFDELAALHEHHYGQTSRELLEYASLVHDIGGFLSHANHQKHAYYLIRNSDLPGFDDTELDVMANVALYHRKAIPKKSHPNMAELTRLQRRRVSALAALLRLAEGMDRGHRAIITDIRLENASSPRRFVLTLLCTGDCELEVWGVEHARDLFEYVFEAPLEVRSERIEDGGAGQQA